jgi:lipoate-protein ligase A
VNVARSFGENLFRLTECSGEETVEWRLLDTGVRTAAENMALDDALLECRSSHLTPDTLRFLRFNPPAVLVGYHQDVEQEVRLSYVEEKGIDVNRRLTGGGAIYFDQSSIGWEIVASKSAVPNYHAREELFKWMCQGVIYALKTLGVEGAFRPKNDVEVNGRKISGTGGVERGEVFLFQGTLLTDFDVDSMIRALRIPIVKLKDKELKSVKQRVTCLSWELGSTPSYQKIKEALVKGFEKALKVRLIEGSLTEAEENMFKEKLPYFQSDQWIYSDRRLSHGLGMVHAVDKTPGGLVRVSLALDRESEIIKQVFITGDFFTFPSRAILDLEAALKATQLEEAQNIVESFFAEKSVQIVGVTPGHIVELILEAADKLSFEKIGLSEEEVNCLYPVLRHSLSENGFEGEYLLLPYCAKDLSCKHRFLDSCEKCGVCSVGEAYELAERVGMKVITILSFEHLMEVLEKLRREKARGYVGCCCEAFYCKHRDDLEQAGVPGLIIGIEDQTCYDLGKEGEAYKGEFNAQTKLKTDLLEKLLPQVGRRR